jgi:hypothetical protein
MQVVSEAKDNFRKGDDVRWQLGVPPNGHEFLGHLKSNNFHFFTSP